MLFLWFRMDTIWFPGEHYTVLNVDTIWFPGGCLVVSMLTPHGCHMDITWLQWFPHDSHRWKWHYFHGQIPQDGNNIISTSFLWVEMMSFPGGNHMVSMSCLNCSLQLAWKLHILLFPCHFHMDTTWFQIWTPRGFKCGHHVISMQTPCDVQEITWKPAQKTALHEANWLPC